MSNDKDTIRLLWEAISKKMDKHEITAYRLWKMSGVPEQTIGRMRRREGLCGLETAKKLAESMGIKFEFHITHDANWQPPAK